MATGVPVVATDVGAFKELIIEGETGTVIPPDDHTEMVAAVANWLNDDGVPEIAATHCIQL